MTTGTQTGGFGPTGPEDRTYKRDKDGKFSSGGGATGQDALAVAAIKGELSPPETAAVERMGGDGGYVVNAALRTGNPTEKDKTTAAQVDSVMARSPLSEDVVVHRSLGDPQKVFGGDGQQFSGGDTTDLTGLSWKDNGYVSTAVNAGNRPSARVSMRILAPKGTPGFSHPGLDSDEILLGRGLTFTVVADHGKDDNFVRQLDVQVSGG